MVRDMYNFEYMTPKVKRCGGAGILIKKKNIGYRVRNDLNLPNQDIIERYTMNGASIWNTATDGAIHIKYQGNKFALTTERQKRSKYWNK